MKEPSDHTIKSPPSAELVRAGDDMAEALKNLWTGPGPYVELFARAPRLGWDSWGHGYEVAS